MSTLTWADVLINPHLQNLPFKINLNRLTGGADFRTQRCGTIQLFAP